jgi:hypothetical protein
MQVMLDAMYWAVQGRVVMTRFSGKYTLEDVEESISQYATMVVNEGKPPFIHNIMDGTTVTELSQDVLSLIKVSKLMRSTLNDTRVGWILSVDPDPHPVLRFVGVALMQMTKVRYRHLSTMEEAIAFLADVDDTLPSVAEWMLAPTV